MMATNEGPDGVPALVSAEEVTSFELPSVAIKQEPEVDVHSVRIVVQECTATSTPANAVQLSNEVLKFHVVQFPYADDALSIVPHKWLLSRDKTMFPTGPLTNKLLLSGRTNFPYAVHCCVIKFSTNIVSRARQEMERLAQRKDSDDAEEIGDPRVDEAPHSPAQAAEQRPGEQGSCPLLMAIESLKADIFERMEKLQQDVSQLQKNQSSVMLSTSTYKATKDQDMRTIVISVPIHADHTMSVQQVNTITQPISQSSPCEARPEELSRPLSQPSSCEVVLEKLAQPITQSSPCEAPPEKTSHFSPCETLPEKSSQSSPCEVLPEKSSQSSPCEVLPEKTSQSSPCETLPEKSSQPSPCETLPEKSSQSSPCDTLPEKSSQPSPCETLPEKSSQSSPCEAPPEKTSQSSPCEAPPEKTSQSSLYEALPEELDVLSSCSPQHDAVSYEGMAGTPEPQLTGSNSQTKRKLESLTEETQDMHKRQRLGTCGRCVNKLYSCDPGVDEMTSCTELGFIDASATPSTSAAPAKRHSSTFKPNQETASQFVRVGLLATETFCGNQSEDLQTLKKAIIILQKDATMSHSKLDAIITLLKQSDYEILPPPADSSEQLCEILQHEALITTLRRHQGSKSIETTRRVIRRLVTKRMAMKFSLSGLGPKRQPTKLAFKEHIICKPVIDTILALHPISRHEAFENVKLVLKGAGDWDGGRRNRHKELPGVATSPQAMQEVETTDGNSLS